MIDLEYAARHAAGAWKMVWGREGWQSDFDRSVDGVFRSFQAMLIAAPIALVGYFALRRAADRIPEFAEASLLRLPYAATLAAEMAGFVLDWFVSLGILVFAARALGAGRRAADVIIGFNWAQIFIVAGQSAPLVLLGFGAGQLAAAVAFFPAIALVVAVMWGVIRRGMGAGLGATAGIIGLLMISGVVVGAAVSSLALAIYGSPAG